eukprot:CAMPEP_0171299432 /NCGR_PEP_ID=MMETSP0816-20121228/8253_1 /TAXON_ID=420281 /ORGANISM="Proboscia inermis, Strain CCAP1064/1" /LENGTH=170 /DNA_ID=CAMNT_0011775225 /DNA_START=346 /DNA_END=855 /DNA_ORIENTATION=+
MTISTVSASSSSNLEKDETTSALPSNRNPENHLTAVVSIPSSTLPSQPTVAASLLITAPEKHDSKIFKATDNRSSNAKHMSQKNALAGENFVRQRSNKHRSAHLHSARDKRNAIRFKQNRESYIFGNNNNNNNYNSNSNKNPIQLCATANVDPINDHLDNTLNTNSKITK